MITIRFVATEQYIVDIAVLSKQLYCRPLTSSRSGDATSHQTSPSKRIIWANDVQQQARENDSSFVILTECQKEGRVYYCGRTSHEMTQPEDLPPLAGRDVVVVVVVVRRPAAAL